MKRGVSAERILILGALYLLTMAFPMPSHAFFSNGVDGAFYPLGNTILDIPEGGVFNFTTITIDPGITVTFNKNGFNNPVFLLATDSVTIRGNLDVSAVGESGGPGGQDARGTIGLPGVGGGDIRITNGLLDDAQTFHGGHGGTTGGGGGAIWISTASDIIIGGSILANGAPMGGSGGSIHLETPFVPGSLILLESTSNLLARGYYGGGGGYIYLASNQLQLDGIIDATVAPLPIPGAVWLLGSGLIGVLGFRKKFGMQ